MPAKITLEVFKQRSIDKHNNKFDYSLSVYINNRTKTKIICPTHGVFEQVPDDHMRGIGCNLCGVENRSYKRDYNLNIDVPLGSKYIPLTQGEHAIVDEEDYDRLIVHKWHAKFSRGSFYSATFFMDIKKAVPMHRYIMNVTDVNLVVDHINHNTLDNRKVNLRVCKQSENTLNRTPVKNKTSEYLGVHTCQAHSYWTAKITRNGKATILGRFWHEIDAAKAYDEAAKQIHGEFANLNFPPSDIPI